MKKILITTFSFTLLLLAFYQTSVSESLRPQSTSINLNSLIKIGKSVCKSLGNNSCNPEHSKVKRANKVTVETKNIFSIKEKLKKNPFDKLAAVMTTTKLAKISPKTLTTQITELDNKEPVKLKGFYKGNKIVERNFASLFVPIDFKELTPVKLNLAKTESPINIEKVESQLLKEETKIVKVDKKDKKKNNTKIDRISTALAANEKSSSENIIEPKISKSIREPKVQKAITDDFVFYDYSAEDKKDQKMEMQDKIADFMKVTGSSSVVAKTTSAPEQVKEHKQDQNPVLPVIDYQALLNGSPKVSAAEPNKRVPAPIVETKSDNKEKMSEYSFTPKNKKVNTQNYNSELTVFTRTINVNGSSENNKNYEIRFNDDIDDIQRDYGNGKIELSSLLNTEIGIRRGTIFSAGHVLTTTDFVYEDGPSDIEVPLLSEDALKDLITGQNITGLGAQILIKLDDMTEDTDLFVETKYEAKIFLNKNFKVIDRSEDEYSYIMYLGVDPGNTIISFRTFKNQVTSKIIHLSNDEVYFDSNFYAEFVTDFFSLYEDNLLGREQSFLNVDSNKISSLSYEAKITQKSLNRYEVAKAIYPFGTRQYFEVQHLDEGIFIGRWNTDFVDIPSESYMRHALGQFQLSNVSNQCLIQINLTKSAKEFYFNGKSAESENGMRVQSKILDADGVFYSDLSQQSNRIFLLGEEQGTVNIQIRYSDGSNDYIQSYCSEASYLIEQL